uniref:Uncharacterized protein n=1 Tax=Rousettus aegyptiacus TaxID=9407 RepID=A0A7J8CI16_ROUAE|nr:hypothetical protein HJG63_008972 [Rousettus aegyptiacus]
MSSAQLKPALQGLSQEAPIVSQGQGWNLSPTQYSRVTLGKFYCSLGLRFLICKTGEIVAEVVAVGPEESRVVIYRNITWRGRRRGFRALPEGAQTLIIRSSLQLEKGGPCILPRFAHPLIVQMRKRGLHLRG